MKKFLSTLMLMMAMVVMMAMPVSATTVQPGDGSDPSPLPGDEFLEDDGTDELPEDEYLKAPKTGDESFALYAMAMAAIAAAGTVVIAKKKEA